ncbi:MAG: MtrAB system accessory protein LpqB [Mycobacteriaceae bacterium]|nr:MtrAB system accessory protein LpqB [Mycobacteriaceae bacterium]
MTRPTNAGRRVAAAAAMAVAALQAASCASLPSSSSPVPIGTLDRAPAEQTITPPQPRRAPDQLLQDFLTVGNAPAGKHAQARQYLTKEAAAHWDDSARITIVTDTAVLRESQSDSKATYLVRANRVGQLLDNGAYKPDNGSLELRIELVRFGGEWRIDELPSGVIMDRQLFQDSYRAHPLYFPNAAGTALAPDMRWFCNDRNALATQLVAALAAGPRSGLAPAVRNMLAGGVTPNPPTRADGRPGPVGVGMGGVRIDFRGASALDQRSREILAAQVIWTLDGSRVPGGYQLLADGKPLDDRYASGWTVAEVAMLNPNVDSGVDVGLNAVRAGALVQVDNTGLAQVPGYFGGTAAMQSAALSRDGKQVAAVVGDRTRRTQNLMVGTYGGGAAPVNAAARITRPSWSPDNRSVWAVLDTARVVRATRDPSSGEVTTADVDTAGLAGLGKQISELRISRDGTRAAMIIDGRVVVAVVVLHNGRWALANAHPVPLRPGAQALSLDWSSGHDLLVSTAGGDAPLVSAQVDGAVIEPFTSQNLIPPIGTIDATATTFYAKDNRTVMQLKNNDPSNKDRYWREVPYLAGVDVVPVLPG